MSNTFIAYFIRAPVSTGARICELAEVLISRWHGDYLPKLAVSLLIGPLPYSAEWMQAEHVSNRQRRVSMCVCELWCLELSCCNISIECGLTIIIQDGSFYSLQSARRRLSTPCFETFIFSSCAWDCEAGRVVHLEHHCTIWLGNTYSSGFCFQRVNGVGSAEKLLVWHVVYSEFGAILRRVIQTLAKISLGKSWR